ncbi:MAG: helix-turn-helix domain-containing protein [Geopsychrobacter sp.]|nr:helix-turn-helix domain-containing protein [Geopsychrobacter sp.]
MKTIKEDVGARIHSIRKSLGFSLSEFGDTLCLGKTAVHQYEKGMTSPNFEVAIKIAKMGDVSLDWLIAGKEPQQKKGRLTTEQLFAGAINNPEFMQKISAAVRQTADTPASGEPLKKDERELLENYRIISEDLQSAAQSMIKAWAIESRENAGGGSDLRAKKLA